MSLYIRQIVLVAQQLEPVVHQLSRVMGAEVCFRDPGVGEFGLENAMMVIGEADDAQFLEVVAPIRSNTAAGRHLERHGPSGYMLLLQTDDLVADRVRLSELGVRIIWQASHPDINAMHLHPKDIGGAIVSIDQPSPSHAWRWGGPNWHRYADDTGAQQVVYTRITSPDAQSVARRWATVLGVQAPEQQGDQYHLKLEDGTVIFDKGEAEVITGFGLRMADLDRALAKAEALDLPIQGNTVMIGGVSFELSR